MSTRRQFLARVGATSALAQFAGLSFAGPSSAGAGEGRFVLVLLRGALDGLSAMPPHGDPQYAPARGELAIAAPGAAGGSLRLDSTFGLHPALAQLHSRFLARELVAFHAVASPYRQRSHFDAQNVLENGTERPAGTSGWLNRGISHLPSPARARQSETGLAVGQNVPLVLRGAAPVTSWAPSLLPEVDADLLQRLSDLYAGDEVLSGRLADSVAIDVLAGDDTADMKAGRQPRRGGGAQRLKLMAESAGKLLCAEDGPRIAVLESSGWDTHAQQGAATGQLATRLQGLDATLAALAAHLQPVWNRTAILVVTEFGRTVARNGSRGTDHGTGTCAFLVGGAIAGGRVVADWPGLAQRSRFEGRDLAPTLDVRAICKSVLHEHMQVAMAAMEGEVFPGSAAAAPPVPGLLRG